MPYPLGFLSARLTGGASVHPSKGFGRRPRYLRGSGLQVGMTLPKVSGGWLGKSIDYEINLKTGEYVYSCPLNPTPNYRLVVKN